MRPKFCLFLMVLAVCPGAVNAGSVLNFPRLSFQEHRLVVGIAVATPGGQDAALTITAYGGDGKLLAAPGFNNPVQEVLPNGQQYAKLTFEIFGAYPDASEAAWFQVTSLLALNAKSANQQLKTLFFPQMAVLGPWKTEIGVLNYSMQADIVIFTAYKPDGTPYGPADLQNNPVARNLSPRGSLPEDAAVLFGFRGDMGRCSSTVKGPH